MIIISRYRSIMKFSLFVRINELLVTVVALVVSEYYVGVVSGSENNTNTSIINYDASNINVTVDDGEKFSIVDLNNNSSNNNGCDESKCVSTGGNWRPFNNSFTCYTGGNGRFYRPMMCADGYKPRIVDTEEPLIWDDIPYQYFTCCPPNLSPDVDVSRHCSNTTSRNCSYDQDNNTLVCDDTNKPYPRQMRNRTKDSTYIIGYSVKDLVKSYICCDSPINGNENGNNYETTNFLDEIECVPYSNEFYRPSFTFKQYGYLEAASCDDPKSGFQFPKYDEYLYYDNGYIHHYECCKSKEGSSIFFQNSAFKNTIYPQIAISAIAVISSMVLIIALLIPLHRNLRTQSKRSAQTSAGTRSPTNARTRPQAITEREFSSYNLYLVYLAIPDLILNMYLLIMYGSYANQQFNPIFYGSIVYVRGTYVFSDFESAFTIACSTANLYLNCVVLHEILILLRNCYQVVRCDPPSLLKVTLQATAVYLFSIIVFVICYFIQKPDLDFVLSVAYFCWSGVVAYLFPVIFFFYVLITIKCRGYMPSVTGRMKQLVWYFFRIVFIFCLIWLPGMFCVVFGAAIKSGFIVQIGLLFCGIQPIVSICMAMTKSDVKKYIMDLITLSCVRRSLPEETHTDNRNE